MRRSLQSILVVTAFAAALGMGLYQTQRAARLSVRARALEQEQAGSPEKLGRLQEQCVRAAQRNAAMEAENRALNRNPNEVLKLRDELTRLRADSQELARLKALEREQEELTLKNEVTLKTPAPWLARVNTLKTWIAAHPDQQIPEFQYLQGKNWLDVVKGTNLGGDYGPGNAAYMLRSRAKEEFGDKLSVALRNFVAEHKGDLPNDLRQLNAYLSPPLTDDLVSVYKLVYSGKNADVPAGKWPIVETRPPQEPGDAHVVIGTKMYNRSRE
jgi:hypothetical protein